MKKCIVLFFDIFDNIIYPHIDTAAIAQMKAKESRKECTSTTFLFVRSDGCGYQIHFIDLSCSFTMKFLIKINTWILSLTAIEKPYVS